MRDRFLTTLKQYALEGTLNQKRVANGILYYYETKKEIMDNANKIPAHIDPPEYFTVGIGFTDYRTAAQRLGKFTWAEKLAFGAVAVSGSMAALATIIYYVYVG